MTRARPTRLVALSLVVAGLVFVAQQSASADCNTSGDLVYASQTCTYSPDEVRDLYASSASEGYRYKLNPACAIGGAATCQSAARCPDPPGTFLFDVLQSPDVEPPSWTVIGQTCLTQQQAGDLGAITPGMVLEAFRALRWPEPQLSVQPPDGETLVNFETNFFTTLAGPDTQTVTLIGIQVTIEATPRDYRWHFGDGADETTSSPGAAYPHLEITHQYARRGQLSPSVDVVYAGRYRIDGGGWTDIPGTLTVPGPTVALRVLEAKPQLVG